MLLVHQAGSVKIGEVVRYTLTYTPSTDRILPSPSHLHVKIKNTSAIPLRAAYLHGPYTLHVATYPSTFNPNRKLESPKRDGVPEFEPNLKAGGHWSARLTIPEDIRETGHNQELRNASSRGAKSATWIIEITSQIIFSNSATVSYELLVGRDSRSLELGFAAVAGLGHGEPGLVQDQQQGKGSKTGSHRAQPKGIYSKAVKLVVEDTTSLWRKPALPQWKEQKTQADEEFKRRLKKKHGGRKPQDAADLGGMPAGNEEELQKGGDERSMRKKKVHLVMLTHGLHSNVGADMLYLKESIDAAAKEAREAAKERRRKSKTRGATEEQSTDAREPNKSSEGTSTAPLSGGQEEIEEDEGDEDDEQIIVRGFSDNVVRTERGIQYLGKRLAKYIFYVTYPSQPFLPVKRSMTRSLTGRNDKDSLAGSPSHPRSTMHDAGGKPEELAYRISSISFVGHSLGGLVQMYAIAYIQKHSPEFFNEIQPINFITMASPLLGLSNENPMYVKFALDFGLVGRTGQDLGLTWRAPTIARHGWTAMVAGLGAGGHKEHRQRNAGAKPLLRVLPTGPAHQVLRKFRHRTVYSNVVNDGIVPLRTSCLLFLDWRGLGKVNKARRENGLIGTMAEWGWAELTGANTSSQTMKSRPNRDDEESQGQNSPTRLGSGNVVPQPAQSATNDDTAAETAKNRNDSQSADEPYQTQRASDTTSDGYQSRNDSSPQPGNSFWGWLSALRPKDSQLRHHVTKSMRAFTRGQTLESQSDSGLEAGDDEDPDKAKSGIRREPRGESVTEAQGQERVPPQTSFFEAAGDILNPPIPPTSWLIDPASRPRTIFHDRVYHPEDIPPPPTKPVRRRTRSLSGRGPDQTSDSASSHQHDKSAELDSNMKVEERIARAYHRDLTWRKVLVSLEPDAHNNIIVRRMFANAYGWPVIKHLCDTHFADTYTAVTRDEDEPGVERAKGMDDEVGEEGEEVRFQRDKDPPPTDESKMREARCELVDTQLPRDREDSSAWDDKYFEGADDVDTDDEHRKGHIQWLSLPGASGRHRRHSGGGSNSGDARHSEDEESGNNRHGLPSSAPRVEGHRGLGLSLAAHQTASQTSDEAETAEPGKTGAAHGGGRPIDATPTPPSVTEVGLRNAIEQTVASHSTPEQDQSRQRSGSHSISEQVARFSTTGKYRNVI